MREEQSDVAFISGGRYRVKSTDGASVMQEYHAGSPAKHHLPMGTIVICAEVRHDHGGHRNIRISSPAGWVDETVLEPAPPIEKPSLTYEDFLARHLDLAEGELYGLAFPFTLDMLQDFGPDFLTRALRASNYISADNGVTEIVGIKQFGGHGASINAFVTVAYERQEPGLHTKLFVKVPRPELDYKYYNSRGVAGETEMVHFSQIEDFPVHTARCCFADYSRFTLNYLLITECVPFGIAPIEPAWSKGYDHLVPDIEEHYRVRARAQARLVSAFKSGKLGYDVEARFPFAQSARNFDPIVNGEAQVDRLIDFVERVAPQLFPAAATDRQFLARWRDDLLFGLEHKDTVVDYLHSDVDYTALCHFNLTIDNAWYWRNDTGALQVGLLDWGGAGQMSIGQALSGMVMMLEPEKHLSIVKDLIETFMTECAKLGGPVLDREELTLHYKASLFSTAICSILTLILDVIDGMPEEKFSAAESWRDDWLLESGMVAVVLWIDNMLREWLDDLTPGEACRIIVDREAGSQLAAVV